MKVLADTNIWLDVLMDRAPHDVMSKAALAACINDEVAVLVAATSLKDIFYLVRKHLGAPSAYEAVRNVLGIAEVAPTDGLVCKSALDLEKPDYEDGVIAASALAENVDCIITRDASAFESIGVAKHTPEEFMKAQGYQEIDFD